MWQVACHGRCTALWAARAADPHRRRRRLLGSPRAGRGLGAGGQQGRLRRSPRDRGHRHRGRLRRGRAGPRPCRGPAEDPRWPGPDGCGRPAPCHHVRVATAQLNLLCVDVGSTFTKAALCDPDGTLLARGATPTTLGTDVLDGVSTLADQFAAAGHEVPRLTDRERVLLCSSAGGGLRLAVVGYERQVTAEAGQRVGLSAGAKVVHIATGPMRTADVAALRA